MLLMPVIKTAIDPRADTFAAMPRLLNVADLRAKVVKPPSPSEAAAPWLARGICRAQTPAAPPRGKQRIRTLLDPDSVSRTPSCRPWECWRATAGRRVVTASAASRAANAVVRSSTTRR